MNSTIQKWGNSLALRIPKALATETHLKKGSVVTLLIHKGKLVVKPIAKPEYTLKELLRGVAKKNIHSEVDTGHAVGLEVW